jgi:hypothetical protein
MIHKTTLLRHVLGAAAVVAAAGALLVPAGAKAAFLGPVGAVTNAQNGTIWYFVGWGDPQYPTEEPHVDGWATDPAAGSAPINVTADVKWYRTRCFVSCLSVQVGRTSVSQTANLPETATAGTFYGPNHGFSITLPWFFGSYDREQVCVTAIHVGFVEHDSSLGCYDLEGFTIN